MSKKRKRVGALIIFKEGTTKEEAARLLARLRGKLDTDWSGPRIEEFNPEWGSPVWYIP